MSGYLDHDPDIRKKINLEKLEGLVLIIGAADTGKSTLAAQLFLELSGEQLKVAFVDGDPGQSSLGPPTTLTLVLDKAGERQFPPSGPRLRSFVGSISPRGHMLPLLVSSSRLVRIARQEGATTILYDTTGLVDPSQGGVALKLAKINLLEPAVVIAVQRGSELEPLLIPLRRSKRVKLIELPVSDKVVRKDIDRRQSHRKEKFAVYFENARRIRVAWNRWPVFPAPQFALGRLVGFEDCSGLLQGLGVISRVDREARTLELVTPLIHLESVDALVLGDLLVDLATYSHRATSY